MQSETLQPGAPTVTEAAQTVSQTSTPILDAVVAQSERAALQLAIDRFEFGQRRAKLFARSGLFALLDMDAEQAIACAMVKIELGESMGFSPAESLQGIYIIKGQTAIAASLRAARMQTAGYSWDLEWLPDIGMECGGCRLWLYYRNQAMMQPVRDNTGHPTGAEEHVCVAFTRADAERMLTKMDNRRVSILEKDNWKMSPRNMYFARAVTNAQRWHAPAVLSINLASVEEVQDLDMEPPPRGSAKAALEIAEEKIARLKAAADASAALAGNIDESAINRVAQLSGERVPADFGAQQAIQQDAGADRPTQSIKKLTFGRKLV